MLRLLKIIEPYSVEQECMANAPLLMYRSEHLKQNFFFIALIQIDSPVSTGYFKTAVLLYFILKKVFTTQFTTVGIYYCKRLLGFTHLSQMIRGSAIPGFRYSHPIRLRIWSVVNWGTVTFFKIKLLYY
jgi:hypothetical protein